MSETGIAGAAVLPADGVGVELVATMRASQTLLL
jgi:hypothetical protein